MILGSDLDPNSPADISMVGPGAYGMDGDSGQALGSSVYLERMCTDIGSLKKQYSKLKQRQTQAHVIIAGQCNTEIITMQVSVIL